MIASLAIVTLTVLMLGGQMVNNLAASAQTRATPTPTPIELNRDFRPIDIAPETPDSDGPALGVPTETPVTEEIPTDTIVPTEDVIPSEVSGEPHRGASYEGSITILKRSCPDPKDNDLTADELAEACQGTVRNIEFTLTDDSGARSGTTGDDGSIVFDGVIAEFSGQVLVTETVPDSFGEPIVYCRVNLGEVQEPGPLLAMPVSDGGISLLPVTAPDTYTCFWYNIPASTGGDSNSVSIWKLNCPAGTANTLTEAEYAELCQKIGRGVEFTLTDDAGDHKASTIDSGFISWSGVTVDASGQIEVQETIPVGFGEPVVFCEDTSNNLNVAPNPQIQPNAADGRISLPPLAPPYKYTCWWYNIPTGHPSDGDNAIELWKHYCPVGTSDTLTIADYMQLCTEPKLPTTFTLTDPDGSYPMTTDANGYTRWLNISAAGGQVAIAEELLPGYGTPQVFCEYSGQQPEQVPATNGYLHLSLVSDEFRMLCQVFNIPTGNPDNMVEIQKYFCPAGTSDGFTAPEYMASCMEPLSPTTFTLTDPDGSYPKTTDQNGYVSWKMVSTTAGQVAIAEELPPGYGTPQVFCQNYDENATQLAATNGYMHLTLPGDEFRILCRVFNIPTDLTSSLTIVKYACPEGYDLYAPGANPGFDCQTLTDGIPFVLDDGMPGLDLGGATGDNGPGTVSFADVKPGSYTVEELVPQGMGDPFVLKCEGDLPQLQPYPLWSGNNLPITLTPGNAFWCFWYNVPAPEPDSGTLTVTKYACTTEVFVSTVDCQVYEDGQVIDLLEWDGGQWDKLDTEQTDAFGRIVWTNLPIGHYLLTEPDGTWCHIESSALLGNDGSFNLNLQGGLDQTVDLYNCGFDPKTPDGTPTDWPKTGAGETHAATRGDVVAAWRIPPVEGGEPATPTTTMNRCLAADDPLAVSGDAECPRGAVPVTIRIAAIDVNAPVEVKETVSGQMQQPTGETAAAWYKESPRLGEPGNMLFAGHLNWWGVPEAVFFHLGDLTEGDEIVIADESGREWTYRVRWVRQDDTFVPPSADVVGPTETASITLITCGGDWNAETGLYDKRTVVRAELVSGPGVD